MKKIILLICISIYSLNIQSQGLTNASISGQVLDSKGEVSPGVLVVALHIPSNTRYGGKTNQNGNYFIQGLRVGGPYKVVASIMGMGEDTEENLILKLGNNAINFKLTDKSNEIKEVVISAKSQAARNRMGSETVVGKDQLMSMPTLSRDINDFTRMTPEANLSNQADGISIGGQNNRMNSIYIDGAVSNDVFGLSATGANGGQTGSSPFSIDAIESFQIQTSPYDVKIGGFAGGVINAITRSGSNSFEGSAYMLYRNQDMSGTTPNVDENLRKKLNSFSAQTYGVRIGLPLKKDKVFLFTNFEYTNEQRPLPFTFNQYQGNSKQAQIDNLAKTLMKNYGFDPGTYLQNSLTIQSIKFITKLDLNLNEKNKLSFRYNFTKLENNNASATPRSSNATQILFSSNLQNQPNLTHSFASELNTTIKDNIHNTLVLGYTNVVDDRGSASSPFPQVTINDGSGNIVFGTEAFSSINLLKQNIYSLTDNVTVLHGKHQFTFGTHNEFYNIFNAFVGEGLGAYTFANLNTFLNKGAASQFRQSYSLVDKVANDNTKAAADFNALQLGFYAQDEIQVSNKLKLSIGLRADIPIYLTNPSTNDFFNDSIIRKIEARGYDLSGAKIGQMPNSSIHLSPRVGFNYDVKGDASTIVRGGSGLFTSRIPFVWIGGLYSNSGNLIGAVPTGSYTFNPDPNAYIPNTVGAANREVDLIEKDFKLPQFWKSSLAIDQKLPAKHLLSVEASFTKTLNNYSADNYARYQTNTTTGINGENNRPYYGGVIDSRYATNIIVMKNTGLGYAWNISTALGKNTKHGLNYNLGYSYGVSKVGQEPTSSQNRSNWRYIENTSGRNFLSESYSDFDMGHRVFGNIGFRKEYKENFASSINIFFNGQNGKRFSWVAGTNSATNDGPNGGTGVDLLYIPTDLQDAQKINFVNNGTYTASQQMSDYMSYIDQNEYLKSRKGQYVERNGDRLPFQFNIDLRLAQEFFVKHDDKGKRKQSFEVTFDIFNLTNLINNEWGIKYYMTDDAFRLLNVVSNTTNKTTYNFIKQTNADGSLKDYKTTDDLGVSSSRWQGQLGLRYNF